MNTLTALGDQVRTCQQCRLARTRTHAVPGSGSPTAEIVFIGEGPGYHEDQQGLPFVGASGKFLDELLASIGFTRQQVYITNVVKCRPPNNRDPQPDELTACRPYLDRQIELIQPRIIVTLGRYSMQLAFSGVTITRVHGTAKRIGDIVYYPMFHPAAALHQPKYRTLIEEDILRLPSLLADLKAGPEQPKDNPPPEQLALF